MVRTTPRRPVDVTKDFPELAPMARTALRLHPRAGAPTIEESSVGGPLLWPADEPWPVCERPHPHACHETSRPGVSGNGFMRLSDSVSPETVRVYRRLLQQAWDRGRDDEGRVFTPDDEAVMNAAADADLEREFDDPTPMLPIVQLYLRDAHGVVTGPDGADLLQVLWCPFNHEPEYMPTSRIRWRRSADVVDRLLVQPEPALIEEKDYFPNSCVVHPEPVTEYPAPHMLPAELRDRIHEHEEIWEQSAGIECYQFDLGVAPGWKIGGWGPWSFRDPSPMTCPECGTEQQPFLYVDSGEWDGGTGSWIPLEDLLPDAWPHQHPHAGDQVQVNIGRGYGMQIYACPASFDHPVSSACSSDRADPHSSMGCDPMSMGPRRIRDRQSAVCRGREGDHGAAADLIGSAGLEDVHLAEAAEMLGITVDAAIISRQRAQARLVTWLEGRPVPSRTALKDVRRRGSA